MKHKQNNADVDVANLAREYGVPPERMQEAIGDDASRRKEQSDGKCEARPEPAAEAAATSTGPEERTLENSRNLAAAYSMDREQFEQLLVAVGAEGVDQAGEKRYDAADVAARLAQRDAKAAGATVVGFDAIQSDELAQALLAEILDDLFKKWGAGCSEPIVATIAAAKRNAAGRMSTFALKKARCAIDAAPTPQARTAAEWALLAELEQFRAAMMQMLRKHRQQKRGTEDGGNADV